MGWTKLPARSKMNLSLRRSSSSVVLSEPKNAFLRTSRGKVRYLLDTDHISILHREIEGLVA